MNRRLLGIVTLSFLTIFSTHCFVRLSPHADDILKLAKKLLPVNSHILEAGAADGYESATMAQSWPKGILYAFEPVLELFTTLQKNVAGLSNAHIFRLALSDRKGTATFHISELNENPGVPFYSGSLLEPKDHLTYVKQVSFPRKITVPTTTIDAWAQENNIKRIDFMWLDMQGHELTALKHANSILNTVKLIYIEVSFVKAYANQALYTEVKQWLEAQGFEVYGGDFDQSQAALGNKIAPGQQFQGNALFIRSSYRKFIGA